MAAQTSASQPGPKLKEQSAKGYERIIQEILRRSGYLKCSFKYSNPCAELFAHQKNPNEYREQLDLICLNDEMVFYATNSYITKL